MWLVTLVLCLISSWSCSSYTFPADFQFGVATSAYQVEGAWNVSDKSQSIWDEFTHRPLSLVDNNATGDIACDSYHQWERDVQMLKELGVQFYRFSISWPRLLPSGYPDAISADGALYYNRLIDSLLAVGVNPVVTLYHNDLPQRLQDLGGWANPAITNIFADYSRVVYQLFGDRVKFFLTINEPFIVCSVTYGMGVFPPALPDPDIGYYLCAKNTLVAHAKAYKVYDEEFRKKYGGEVSLLNQFFWLQADSPENEEHTEMAHELMNAMYVDPIFTKEGGWPKKLEKYMMDKSRREGFSVSRLPAFTEDERKLLIGSSDTLSFNYYSSRAIRPARVGETPGPLPLDVPELGLICYTPDEEGWTETTTYWLPSYPAGLRKLLSWLRARTSGVSSQRIHIMENGVATRHDRLYDLERVEYIKKHMEQVLLAIVEDGINVMSYGVWSLMDNFEWVSAYSQKFGLYRVDFNSTERTRIPRLSAKFYKRVVATRSLDVAISSLKNEL